MDDELRRHVLLLAGWVLVIRAVPYALQALQRK
jgi:hypothetical protein